MVKTLDNRWFPISRRSFLGRSARSIGAAIAGNSLLQPLQTALALEASNKFGSIADVEHIVILMQENRSFDHYFGSLRGVRGFGDRHLVPLATGKSVWYQSDGQRVITPFHLDTKTTNALKTPATPHTYDNAQAAWNQGRFGLWPKFKTPMSMGYYRRHDIPFQFALAEAFTICDAHHCSITTGTDPNRVMFWSGSNHDPRARMRGEDSTADNAEVNNLRCMVTGAFPESGYSYKGTALSWPTIPDELEKAGVSWQIYQDANDNWNGLMHGGLAFESFRNARPGSALYKHGMESRSLNQLETDVKEGRLPAVSWILPPMDCSEHPSPSSALEGAAITTRILNALTARPEVWSKSVLFLTFDENDGLFDHVPPPAPPSYDEGGRLLGKSTVGVQGLYFLDQTHAYIHPEDPSQADKRPWGLGPRVPLYIISPWSRGGWVNSQVFDHTSIGQFIERRFGITVPAISDWHRAVCGDLTSAFDFINPNHQHIPRMPDVRHVAAKITRNHLLPSPSVPSKPETLFQERGHRPSRALPYEMNVISTMQEGGKEITLDFINTGRAGAVFHVYDKHNLEAIPKRYTVEAGKHLADTGTARTAYRHCSHRG